MNLFKKINDLSEKNIPFVIATIIKSTGSAPGKVGFKMITDSNANSFGTVGGGAIEVEIQNDSLHLLFEGNHSTKEYLLSNKNVTPKEDVTVVPMMCSGKVTVYFEVHGSLPSVYIFGGGHVGNALLKVLSSLDYFTTLIDNRDEFANSNTNPHASQIILQDYEKYLAEYSPVPDAYYILLTHGHNYDYIIMKELYERNIEAKYIGIIASNNKAAELKGKLKNDLGENINLDILHTPIGLPIGGDSASEIALSIAAEIQLVRYGKSL